jgi:uncharacterized caspase-like protein
MPPPVAAPPPRQPLVFDLDPTDAAMVAARSANVRGEPDQNAARLATLREGEAVSVIAKVRGRDWLKVRLKDDKTEGFVLTSLLKEPPPPPRPAAPVAAPAAPVAPVAVSSPSDVDFGRYHALVIGNQRYQGIKSLATPEADARALAELLRADYGFADVRLLLNATRADMLRALDVSARRIGERDNLLIYYAGHGYLDRGSERGYWLPVDAEADSRVHWLSNADITDTLKATRAKHVLVVADSCYSGALVRAVDVVPVPDADLRRLALARSRTVMTSGGLEPVIDSGGGRHSVFAKAFLDGLRSNDGVMDATKLFAGLRRKVLLNAEQTPQYADIRFAGHDGGDFLFVRRAR